MSKKPKVFKVIWLNDFITHESFLFADNKGEALRLFRQREVAPRGTQILNIKRVEVV